MPIEPAEALRRLRALGPEIPARPTSDFDLNPNVVVPEATLRPAAVLIAITQDGENLVLTKRAAHLKHHPGQVAFPGGKVDPGDADVIAAALREFEEETGMSRSAVDVITALPAHRTVTNFAVTPVVAQLTALARFTPEPGEVDEVFLVPLAHLLDPQAFRVEGRRWRGQRRHYLTVPYGPYYIWGATARMLRGMLDVIDTP